MGKIISASERDFLIVGDEKSYDINITLISEEDRVYVYEICVCPLNENGGALTIKWAYHMMGFLSTWSPVAGRKRQLDAQPARAENPSNLYYSAPVYSVINYDDTNFATVSLSDAINPSRLSFHVNDFEEKENLYFCIFLFENYHPVSEYKFQIRIDERKIPYYDAVGDVAKWWKNFYPIAKEIPENAKMPLYSTWYNFHQNPIGERLLEELSEAADMGFKTVIIDDGWSYPGRGPGDYRFCGNWNVCDEKFPDFKEFVKKLHDMSLSVMLWFPVPFVGYETEEYQRFKDKLLYNGDRFKAGILDPRYPEVRSYIVNSYKETVEKYDLDGLKLDFIDSFKVTDESLIVKEKAVGMDAISVEDGVIKLMSEIKNEFSARKNDFLFEQRQYYIGPALVGNCNMLRVIDCQFDFLTNRIGIADLRLLNYDLAVHADMLLWSHDESVENCSKMLLNIMFSVPQISVLLKKTNEANKKVVKNFIKYWLENKDIIMNGKFKAPKPHMNYPRLSCENDEKRIEVLYSESDYLFNGKDCDIFNATEKDFIYLENESGYDVCAYSYNCFGDLVETFENIKSLCKIPLLSGGMLKIRKL